MRSKRGKYAMLCGAASVKAAFSGTQNRSQLGQTTLWLILRQLSNPLHFSHVPPASPLPKLHYNQTIKSISLPHLKEHKCTCIRGEVQLSVGVKHEFWHILKETCVHKYTHAERLGSRKENCVIIPYLLTTWTYGKLTRIQLLQFYSSTYIQSKF